MNCNPQQYSNIIEFLAPLEGTIFSTGINPGGRCDKQVYVNRISHRFQLSPSPYQLFNPFLSHAIDKFGGVITYLHQTDTKTDNFLFYVKSLCEELNVAFNYYSFNKDSVIDQNTINKIIVGHRNNGFIINGLSQQLSEPIIQFFIEINPPTQTKLIHIFNEYVVPIKEIEFEYQEINIQSIFFLGVTYPRLAASPLYQLTFYNEEILEIVHEPFSYSRVVDAIKIIMKFKTLLSTKKDITILDIINLEIEGAHGIIKFDESNFIKRGVFITHYDYLTGRYRFETVLASDYPGYPYHLSINIKRPVICDFTDIAKGSNYQIPFKNIGIIISSTGNFKDLNIGLYQLLQALIVDKNQNSGLIDYYINPIIYDDKSDIKKTSVLLKKLIDEFNIVVLFGLSEISQKKSILGLINDNKLLFFYFGNVDKVDCDQYTYYFGFTPSVLYAIPLFIKQNSIIQDVLVLGSPFDLSQMESGFLVNSLTRVGINVVGMNQLSYEPFDFESLFKYMVNSLKEGGYIISLLRGPITHKLFSLAEENRLDYLGIKIISIGVSQNDIQYEPKIYKNHYLFLNYILEETSAHKKVTSILQQKLSSYKRLNYPQVQAFDAFNFYTTMIETAKSFKAEDINSLHSVKFDALSGESVVGKNHYLLDHYSLYSLKNNDGTIMFEDLFVERFYNQPIHICDSLDEKEFVVCDWSDRTAPGIISIPVKKVGIMYDLSGMHSDQEIPIFLGLISAIIYVNDNGGLEGYHIAPLIRDTKGSTKELIIQYTKEFIENEEVSIMFGCYETECRDLVLQELNGKDLLLIYTGETMGEECSNRVIDVGALPNQLYSSLLSFLLSNNINPRITIIYERNKFSEYSIAWIKESYKYVGIIEEEMEVDNLSIRFSKWYESLAKKSLESLFFIILSPEIQNLLFLHLHNLNMGDLCQKLICISYTMRIYDSLLLTDYGRNNIYFVDTYFYNFENDYNTKFTSILHNSAGLKFITSRADNSYSAFMLWRNSVMKSKSFNRKEMLKNLINTSADSGLGPIKITDSLYTTHYSIFGLFVNNQLNIVFDSVIEIVPFTYNWELNNENTIGNICIWTEEDDTTSIIKRGYKHIIITLSITGINSLIDGSLAYTIIRFIEDINSDSK